MNLFEKFKHKLTASVKNSTVTELCETTDLSDTEKRIMNVLIKELENTVVGTDRPRNRSTADRKTGPGAEYETVEGSAPDLGVAAAPVNGPGKRSDPDGKPSPPLDPLLSRFSRMVDALDRPDGGVDEAFRAAVEFGGGSVGAVRCPFDKLVDDEALIESVLTRLKCLHSPGSCSQGTITRTAV